MSESYRVVNAAILSAMISARQGLESTEHVGIFVTDDEGQHLTLISEDFDYFALFRDAGEAAWSELELPADVFSNAVMGWPDDWAVTFGQYAQLYLGEIGSLEMFRPIAAEVPSDDAEDG